jgi:hypothetical protein
MKSSLSRDKNRKVLPGFMQGKVKAHHCEARSAEAIVQVRLTYGVCYKRYALALRKLRLLLAAWSFGIKQALCAYPETPKLSACAEPLASGQRASVVIAMTDASFS